ncbi:hypothetical protein ABT120_04255 [Nonomuraea angiospora]|uniref:hypothetical protein n=1 Tax=Nonomuraea angiospora TaxID=46172 RepID=UPI0033276705
MDWSLVVGYALAYGLVMSVLFTAGVFAGAALSLFDLVVLDWIVLVGLRPGLLVLPGTEGMPEYRDLGFHAVEALKGGPLVVVVGLAVGGVVSLAEALA